MKKSQAKCKPSDATKMTGVDIEWDHGDDNKSRAGALERANGFGLAVPPNSTNPPSLTRNPITGEAIDMTITWAGTIKVKQKSGTETPFIFTSNIMANTALHKVGASHGVKKLTTDAPLWSLNGR